ncbi:MAG: hypothetical protein M3R13_08875 [Armatimonadota bacterium]|nr:hypothetical protein [Armatimonadota bacterium]
MRRYTGEALHENAKVAILANDALGNFSICTPLAQTFRRDCPNGIVDYYGGERTRELEEALVGDLFDFRSSILGVPLSEAAGLGLARTQEVGGYDLVVNIEVGPAHKAFAVMLGSEYVCGPSLDISSRGDWEYPSDERGDLWRDQAWAAPDLTSKYPFLESPFIGEIFHRLAYRTGSLPPYRFHQETPEMDIPEVLISTGASLTNKLWPVQKWHEFLSSLDAPAGLLGAPPKRQAEFYHSGDAEQALVDERLVVDLRGKLTLPQVVGALARARAVVTIDNGILHFAAANDVSTVGLYRKEIARLWAPPNPNLAVVTPDSGSVDQITVEAVTLAFNSLSKDAPLP